MAEIVEIACRHCGTLRTWTRSSDGTLERVHDVFASDAACAASGACEPRELASPMAHAYARHLRDTRGRRSKRR